MMSEQNYVSNIVPNNFKKELHYEMNSSNFFPAVGLCEKDAYAQVKKSLLLDGDTAYDLGSFTCTQMDKLAQKLYLDNIDKNLVNVNEYGQTSCIEHALGQTIASMFHLPEGAEYFARSTAGSSEAIGLSMLIHKERWRQKQSKLNRKPNIVLCADAHLSWYKFAQYFSIEVRQIPLLENGEFPFDNYIQQIDEDTIVAVLIVGSTFTGSCDPITDVATLLERHNKENGIHVGIHVDAAIGGFALPFLPKNEQYLWDFRCPLVLSINVSNHKFGLVYPGLGWLVSKNSNELVAKLVYYSKYLFGESQSFSLNFSRPASPVLVQYYNFIHYGVNGYSEIIGGCLHLAKILADLLRATELFTVVSDLSLPVIAFKFKVQPAFKVSEYVALLRQNGWMLPCYELKTPCKPVVMRVVVRNSSKLSDFKKLVKDLAGVYIQLNKVNKERGRINQ
jgi:glutamate decarboxylase